MERDYRNQPSKSSAKASLWMAPIVLATVFVLSAPPTWAASPCCGITAIDTRTGMVTARDNASGQTFQFKVEHKATLKGLKVGQAIDANFSARKVKLPPAGPGSRGAYGGGGAGSCCDIVGAVPKPKTAEPITGARGRVKPAEPVGASGATSSVAQPASAQAPADDDAQDDPDVVEKAKPRPASLNLPKLRPGAQGTAINKYPQAQQLLQQVAQAISDKEIDVALVGGEKYMINKCLGVKASAGKFKLKFGSPNARIEGSGARLTFKIDRVSMNALTIRIRPNASNPLKLCHFSKKRTVGGSATDIKYELRFDPVLDVAQCKLGSIGNVKHRVDIGGMNLKPLQNDLDRAAKNMIEDAFNNAANFNMTDRLVASFNALMGAQCHK